MQIKIKKDFGRRLDLKPRHKVTWGWCIAEPGQELGYEENVKMTTFENVVGGSPTIRHKIE